MSALLTLAFCFFSSLLQPLHRHLVFTQIHVLPGLEVSAIQFMIRSSHRHPRDGCRLRRTHFKKPFGKIQNRDVKSPPPRSKTRMVCSLSLSRPYAREAAVGSIYDSQDFKTGNCACLFSCGPLSIIKVRRHCNNGLRDAFARMAFRVLVSAR